MHRWLRKGVARADRGYAKGLGVEHVAPLLREFHQSTPQSDITVVELSGGHFPGKVFVRCRWLLRRQMRSYRFYITSARLVGEYNMGEQISHGQDLGKALSPQYLTFHIRYRKSLSYF